MIKLKKKKIINIVWLVGVLSVLFAMASFGDEKLDAKDIVNLFMNKSIECDMDKYPACQNYGINEIYADLENNYDINVKKYDNRYLCIAGVIKSVTSNGSKLELADITGGDKTMNVRVSEKEKKSQAAQFKVGDSVRVFGKAGVSKLIKPSVSIELSDIQKTSQTENKSSEIFSFASGKSFDRRESEKRSLCNGAIEFFIPKTWVEVEEKISTTGLDGWMYRLNEIPTEYKTKPEQVYVFFFDYTTGLKNITDRDGNLKDIEKAIINNILGKDIQERGSKKTADGYKFTYYLGNYWDAAKMNNGVEFIFTGLDTRGVMGILYVYKDSKDHKEDIIYMMRTIVKK